MLRRIWASLPDYVEDMDEQLAHYSHAAVIPCRCRTIWLPGGLDRPLAILQGCGLSFLRNDFLEFLFKAKVDEESFPSAGLVLKIGVLSCQAHNLLFEFTDIFPEFGTLE